VPPDEDDGFGRPLPARPDVPDQPDPAPPPLPETPGSAPPARNDDDDGDAPPPPADDEDPIVTLYRNGAIPAAPGDFSASNLLFRSSDGKAAAAFTSLYFTNGRLRLAHDSGGAVALTPGLRRFCITDVGLEAYKILAFAPYDFNEVIDLLRGASRLDERARDTRIVTLVKGGLAKQHCVALRQGNPGWVVDAAIGAPGQLLEIIGSKHHHLSRGAPVAAPRLSQRQVDGLHHAAKAKVASGRMVEIYAHIIANP
jgi:hypothetical protein